MSGAIRRASRSSRVLKNTRFRRNFVGTNVSFQSATYFVQYICRYFMFSVKTDSISNSFLIVNLQNSTCNIVQFLVLIRDWHHQLSSHLTLHLFAWNLASLCNTWKTCPGFSMKSLQGATIATCVSAEAEAPCAWVSNLDGDVSPGAPVGTSTV